MNEILVNAVDICRRYMVSTPRSAGRDNDLCHTDGEAAFTHGRIAASDSRDRREAFLSERGEL